MRYIRAMTPLILQRLIALPYLILGGWCLVAPRSVEQLTLNPDYQHLSATSALLIGCFGAQAVLGGLFIWTLSILERANGAQSVDEVVDLLRQVLFGLRRLLQGKTFDYPIPQRASLDATQNAVSRFLSVSSGGGRLQAVAHALFKGLSEAGFEYDNLVARHVNASDAAGRAPGDVSFSKAGRNTAVEVKDRLLTAAQVGASVTKARVAEVTELVFLVHGDRGERLFASDGDRLAAEGIALKEFSSGLNVYWESYLRLSRSLLVVLGEQGRRDFLKFVGLALEEQSVDAQHRWEWAKIVAEI